MKRLHLAVIGLGQLGRHCARRLMQADDLALAGIVRRPATAGEPLDGRLRGARVVRHWRELGEIDGALLCVPAQATAGVAHDILQQRVPIVECAQFHGEAWFEHQAGLARTATRFGVPALVGAGWDPGMLSLYRASFAMLAPHGHSDEHQRVGVSLHHTAAARNVPGVRDALASELRGADGRRLHYVYVALQAGADVARVEAAVRADPQFLDAQTFVFVVDNIDELEQQGHGVTLLRYGQIDGEHQRYVLEARFDRAAVAAQVMLAAARALPTLGKGAHGLFDVAPRALWGREAETAERRWW